MVVVSGRAYTPYMGGMKMGGRIPDMSHLAQEKCTWVEETI